MITSLQQAQTVQSRRMSLNKCGYAKAVRRYIRREHAQQYQTEIKKLPRLIPKKHQH
jgi:hypothetical protein